MTKFSYAYPGDSRDTCEVLTRAEFLARPGNRTIVIEGFSSVEDMFNGSPTSQEVIPVGEQICCDYCNADPGDNIHLIRNGTYALCLRCAEKNILPYKEQDAWVLLTNFSLYVI